MSCLRASIAFSLLVSVAAAAMPQAKRAVSLTVDAHAHTLGVVSELDGALFLALGPRAVPPIKIAGIEVDVVPHIVLALGRVVAGDALELWIPEGVRSLEAEAVLLDDRLGLHDSNVVALAGAVADLIEATFEATLIDDAGADPRFAVAVSLTAPSSGHELALDSLARSDGHTDVYLRLVEPGLGEIVLPVLTDVHLRVALGDEVGDAVRVHLMRARRGSTGPEVYRLMAELRVSASGR
jgi:hypothetical protein